MRFFNYTLVGGIATAMHYAVLIILVEGFFVNPALAAASGAACGAVLAYAGNRRFTFSSGSSHGRAFPRFILVAAFGAALNGTVVWAVISGLGWHYLLAQVFATLSALVLTYILNRSWTFA